LVTETLRERRSPRGRRPRSNVSQAARPYATVAVAGEPATATAPVITAGSAGLISRLLLVLAVSLILAALVLATAVLVLAALTLVLAVALTLVLALAVALVLAAAVLALALVLAVALALALALALAVALVLALVLAVTLALLTLALLALLAASSAELVLQFLLPLLDRELLGFVLQVVELAHQASDPGNRNGCRVSRFRHTAGAAYPLLIV